MSPVMAALRALVCALIVSFWGAVPALAERRPVAVVNLDLADESKARPLVDQLGYELNVHPELRSLDDSSDSAALKATGSTIPIATASTPRSTARPARRASSSSSTTTWRPTTPAWGSAPCSP
ncbi:MAG: hypothetical protein IPQ07_42510 [Myxococcales bacterium]|nr:hypothetical protein [Myxococcales bacterium]